MNKVLIVIDMQNDFIDGSLGTKEAQTIVPTVKEKIKEYQKRGDNIIFIECPFAMLGVGPARDQVMEIHI